MSNVPNNSKTLASGPFTNLQGLVWNANLRMQDDANQASLKRRQAIDLARSSRPRTAKIEREIMIAVIVLYALILGCFAGLHFYGERVMPQQTEQTEKVKA